MSYVVQNKNTRQFAKIKYPYKEWVENVNSATIYRNKGAALISCGSWHKNTNRANNRQPFGHMTLPDYLEIVEVITSVK